LKHSFKLLILVQVLQR